jgi:hypothetical protein
MAWQNPKTDWAVNPKNPVPEDFNRIEGNIDFLKSDIETKKGVIVDALNTVGLASELTDTHAQIANKIVAANQGTKIYTPGTANITIPKGFHSGQGYVKGDADLKAENIKKGINIFGVLGAYFPEPVVETITFDYRRKGATTIGYGDEVSVSFNFPRRGYFIAGGICSISPRARLVIDGTVIGEESGIGGGKWVEAGERIATWTITSVSDYSNSWMSLAGFMVLFAQ